MNVFDPTLSIPIASEAALLAESRISLRAQLRQQLLTAHQDLGAPDRVRAQLCQTFGGQHISLEFRSALYGLHRAGDEAVITQLLNQLIFKRGQEPVRILEVAAGYSYGDIPNFGAPWLARAIAKAFGHQVQVTVCDKEAEDVQVFVLQANGTLDSVCLGDGCQASDEPKLEFEGDLSQGYLRFHGINWSKLTSSHPKTARYLRSLVHSVHCARSWPPQLQEKLADSKIVLRPSLDPIYENCCYGLRAIRGIDCKKLENHFAPKSFDLIFARHMPLVFDAFAQQAFLRSADRVLTPTGVALVRADR